MSDCCGSPSLHTSPDRAAGLAGSYNPGEIRLYGRPAIFHKKLPADLSTDESVNKFVEEEISNKRMNPENSGDIIGILDVLIKRISPRIGVATSDITMVVRDSDGYQYLTIESDLQGGRLMSVGVIYGYAYEGHCYKLPRPKIMFLPDVPKKISGGKCSCERAHDECGRKDDCDCGCECGYSSKLGYAVWSIDKQKRAIAVDVRTDDLKTLILDENMPGNRSPLTYAQAMALAPQRHRD